MDGPLQRRVPERLPGRELDSAHESAVAITAACATKERRRFGIAQRPCQPRRPRPLHAEPQSEDAPRGRPTSGAARIANTTPAPPSGSCDPRSEAASAENRFSSSPWTTSVALTLVRDATRPAVGEIVRTAARRPLVRRAAQSARLALTGEARPSTASAHPGVGRRRSARVDRPADLRHAVPAPRKPRGLEQLRAHDERRCPVTG